MDLQLFTICSESIAQMGDQLHEDVFSTMSKIFFNYYFHDRKIHFTFSITWISVCFVNVFYIFISMIRRIYNSTLLICVQSNQYNICLQPFFTGNIKNPVSTYWNIRIIQVQNLIPKFHQPINWSTVGIWKMNNRLFSFFISNS